MAAAAAAVSDVPDGAAGRVAAELWAMRGSCTQSGRPKTNSEEAVGKQAMPTAE